jgi:hypothetical protein
MTDITTIQIKEETYHHLKEVMRRFYPSEDIDSMIERMIWNMIAELESVDIEEEAYQQTARREKREAIYNLIRLGIEYDEGAEEENDCHT